MSGLAAQLSALVTQLLVNAAAAQQRWDTVIAPQPTLLVWPLLFAVGVGLVFGLGSRPLPLAERVRRLNLKCACAKRPSLLSSTEQPHAC